MEPWSAVVVGGGILGTSVAYWLSSVYEGRIAVLEREADVAQHASGRNTGAVHRPFYLDPVGRRVFARSAQVAYGMWKVYSKERSLPWNPVGTFEIATHESQLARLEKYYRWGQENGMDADELELLTPEQVRVHEPHVRCRGAIWSKTDTMVDYGIFTRSLRMDAERQGARFLTCTDVKKIIPHRSGVDLHVAGRPEPVKTHFLINCAGGSSVRVAHMLGVGREYTDLNFRGEYWMVNDDEAHMAARNIYTVPRHPEFPFLDPHWIVRANGHRETGPNAVPVAGPYTYRGFFTSPLELVQKVAEPPLRNKFSLLFNPSLLALAWEEWTSSFSKSAMARRVQEFLPELRVEHLTRPGTAGIRAAVIDRDGNFIKEAIELPGPASYHIVNYNSPGATGAPSYAAWLVRKLGAKGHLDHLAPRKKQIKQLWNFDDVCGAIDTPSR